MIVPLELHTIPVGQVWFGSVILGSLRLILGPVGHKYWYCVRDSWGSNVGISLRMFRRHQFGQLMKGDDYPAADHVSFFFFFFGWSIKSGNSLTPFKMCPCIPRLQDSHFTLCLMYSHISYDLVRRTRNDELLASPGPICCMYMLFVSISPCTYLTTWMINQRLFLQQHVISSWSWFWTRVGLV